MRKLCAILILLIGPVWVLTHARAQEARPQTASILIRGGTVIDGTGAPRRRADVRVQGAAIQEIGRLSPRAGERVIDARGMVVAPGFIDTHSHADGGIKERPEAEAPVRQGITTAIVGQDGGSQLPISRFFDDLQVHPAAINFASFVGHGSVRREVMGTDFKRHARPEEIDRMRALVARDMDAGALGLSSGLEYDPGFYSTTEELIACARAASAGGGIYISHVRDEVNQVFSAFRELIRIAEEAHLPAQISHIKLGAASVWGKAGEALDLMEQANRRGTEITADVYPYRAWSSGITVLIPSRDWENRALWQKGLSDVGGPDHVLLVTYSPDPAWVGKTIAQIAQSTGKDAVSIVQEIVRRTHAPGATGSERVVVTAMAEEDVRRFIAAPRVMFCTDAGLRLAHPRGAGSFPRVLGRYVREQHVLTLEQAVHKMTGLPAWRMGLHDRGAIQPGKKADLVLFNAHTVIDTATALHPMSRPLGIPTVMVNGTLVLDAGRITGARPGQALRRNGAARGSAGRTELLSPLVAGR